MRWLLFAVLLVLTLGPRAGAQTLHRVFADTVVPPVPAVSDGVPIEIGVKFRASVAGEIRGLRFYKGAANTGVHVGHLWSAGGALLAEATFTDESAEGWQEVVLASPVAVGAGTTYVASYHSASGYFAFHAGGLAAGIDAPPLRLLAHGEDGANGVYRYGPSGFPANSGGGANYFVDVVFAEGSAPDTTPPTVTSVSPSAAATDVASTAVVLASFDEVLDPASVTSATLELRDAADQLVPAAVSWVPATLSARLAPDAPLAYSASYSARAIGGATGLRDVAGNALEADFTWSFTTQAPPPPGPEVGPGGPILVVASAANPFGRYYAEILRAEGLNAFTTLDLAALDADALNAHELVVLAEATLTPAQVTLLADWVGAGGKLIAFRPDAQLAPLLGLGDPGGTFTGGYVQIDDTPIGAGLPSATLQFHGVADVWTESGQRIASLATSGGATALPAVTLTGVGTNGGRAAAWTYDLARSIVLTRQGNPAWAGTERDGIAPIRASDQFYGAAAGDPQPDWIDLSKVAIPQADEQQRLFARLVRELLGHPFPSFWYFPSFRKAVVVMTGDEHGCCGGTRERWNAFLAADPPGCSVDDWQCVRGTSYVYPGPGMSDAEAAGFAAQGFELSAHVNTGCADWTPGALDAFYDAQLGTFVALFPSVPPPATNRTHCITWSDWASQPEIELAHQVRLDTNYYYWPPAWVADRPGFFTGSGLPMRFARLDGSMIDVYQAATQLTDESSQSFPFTIDTLLDRALGPEGYYGAFTANMHTDAGNGSSAAWAASIAASAQARGVAVVSARQMLEWLDGRNGSSFGALDWNGDALGFTVSQAAGARNLRALLPLHAAGGAHTLVSLTRDGEPIPFATEIVKGVSYVVFAAESGAFVAIYAEDETPPLLTDVVATPGSDGTALVTWTTDEPASSAIAYGSSAETLGESVSDPTLTTEHSLSLSGLASDTTYFFRITSIDASGNASTEPAEPAAPASFVTPAAPCFADAPDVALAPALDEEFDGAALSGDWTVDPWSPGGSAVLVDGALLVDGARVGTNAAFAPPRTLEFTAAFNGEPFQHAGFGVDFNGPTWAIISTGSGGALKARTHNGAVATDTDLVGIDAQAPHDFRIVWTATSVEFWVDGALAVTHPSAIATPMRPLLSDIGITGTGLVVDSLRLVPPYASAGTFTSHVGDAGLTALWGIADWESDTPAGTSLALAVRTGPTPVPDGAWSAFAPLAASGASVGQSGRYVQYRAELATSEPDATPRLLEISFACAIDETADDDADGIPNVHETGTGVYVSPTDTGTNPHDADSDDDGALDGAEVAAGLDPNDPDSDGDGFCDGASAPPAPAPCLASDNCPALVNPAQLDADGDLAGDACDNCVYALNPGQSDLGGAFGGGPDGIGDACQCGDVTDAVHAGFDGAVNAFDVDEARLFLAGASTLPASAILERCAVDGVTGACTVLDWALLARGAALGAPLAQICRPAVCLADAADLDGDCLVDAADPCAGWPSSAADHAVDTNGDGVPDTCQCGDVEPDGVLDVDDQVRYALCLAASSSCDATIADLDRDGDVDDADYAALTSAMGELEAELGCPRRLGPLP